MPKEYQHKTVAGFFSAHRDRWIKGDFQETRDIKGSPVECYCLLGKARELYGAGEYNDVVASLSNAIKDIHPTIFKRLESNNHHKADIVADFNDAKNRTVDQIIEVAQYARV